MSDLRPNIPCVYCPIRETCDTYAFYNFRISDLTSQIIDLRMEMEATTTAADLVEVKHGRWKGEGFGEYSCSLCMEVVCGNDYNYCPYCGARMGGDTE